MDSTQLWIRYKQQGDPAAREALILRYAFLVRHVSERLGITGTPQLDRDDLISHGVIGLIDAVEKYDYERGPRFESYASTRIRGAILDAVRGMDWLPRSVRTAAGTLERAATDLQHTLGRDPSPEELSAATGLDETAIDNVRAYIANGRMNSLEGLLAADHPESGYDSLALMPLGGSTDPAGMSPAAKIEQAEQREILIQAIDTLPPDERLALSLYYFEELTLKEIGRVMNLTESRISQIRTKAMMRLRAHLRAQADVFAAA